MGFSIIYFSAILAPKFSCGLCCYHKLIPSKLPKYTEGGLIIIFLIIFLDEVVFKSEAVWRQLVTCTWLNFCCLLDSGLGGTLAHFPNNSW